MHTYQASMDGKTWRTVTSMTDIEPDLKQLSLGNPNFLQIYCYPPLNGVDTIQADGVKHSEGIFKKRNIRIEYAIEILKWDEGDNEKIYRYITEDYNELYNMFENYLLYQTLPTYELWKDVTNDILGR